MQVLDTTTCPKCSGTGKFVTYSGRIGGDCFACNGTGQARPPRREIPTADAAGVDRLKDAFDHAKTWAEVRGRGIKGLRLTIGNVVISPAGETSANPGALYVKSTDRTYLGKIKDGRFYCSRDCTPDDETRVLAFVKDPKAAAESYGIETGTCCVCNATLTREESISGGIGPICRAKMGW